MNQREIKFRAWDKRQLLRYSWSKVKKWQVKELNEVATDIVTMQYTGLKDHDRKEIYEGDIVEFSPIGSQGTRICQVIWMNDGWFLSDESERDLEKRLYEDTFGQVKVIGNIYENPELLNH